ncbi:MAG: GNAT family N-acetyltransferase [Caulobacteraceae bacterium]
MLGAGLSWAAVVGGDAIGFAIVTRHFFGFPFVDLLLVAEAARRGGVGAALMAKCEGDHNADRIFTSTNESNAPMRWLLAKADWLVSGVIENLDPGDPELVFVKFRA